MRLISDEEIASLKLAQPVPLTNHPAAVYLGSLSKESQRTMRSSLNSIAALLTEGECDVMTLDWSKLRYRHTAAIRTALMQRLAPATVNKMLVALRQVLCVAYRLDLMEAPDYSKAVDLPSVKLSGELRGRALSSEEIHRLMESCRQGNHPIDCRDGAVLAILRCGGMRRAELVSLTVADLDCETGAIRVRQGKGGKRRLVYLNDEALAMVERWLGVRGREPGALICPVNKGGKVKLCFMAASGDAIYKLVKKRASYAGVATFSPHDFRRTFGTDLLSEQEDLLTVQALMGHASPATTAKYDHRGEGRKQKAVRKLKL